MRELEPQRAIHVYAAHRKEPIFNVARRLSRATEMDRVETMHNEEVLSQMLGRDCKVTRPLNSMLNICVQLPAIDVPDHPDSVVSSSMKSVPRSSSRVNQNDCRLHLHRQEATDA